MEKSNNENLDSHKEPVTKTASEENSDSSTEEEEEDDDDDDGDDDDPSGMEARPARLPKLSLIIRQIAEDIRSLYQVSLLLNRPGFVRHYLHSTRNKNHDPEVAHYKSYDIHHLREKFRQWKHQPKVCGDNEVACTDAEQDLRTTTKNIVSCKDEYLIQ